MKLYCKNEKPFVYAVFSNHDNERAISILEKINESDISVWFSEQLTKKEIRRIEAAFSCVLFISNNAIRDEKVREYITCAVRYNKKILCIYLEPAPLSPGLELLLNSLQSIDKSSFADDEAFFEKLKSAEIFSNMGITAAQKRFAKRRALSSVLVPVAAAVIVFFTIVVPLLVIPAVQAANGSLSKVGFGNLSLDALAKVETLYVIGNESFDQWYYSFYTDETKEEVYVNNMDAFVPTGNITDISDLALLKNAKMVAFQANQVSDITPLYKIKTLENLTLNCNPIKSIEGIEALQNLSGVTLAFTEVSDISPLFKIPSLKYISFENTYVRNIEGIGNLPHLLGLRTGNSYLTDISPLNQIDFSYVNKTDGFSFEAKGSLIKDFSPLQRIPKFEEVMVDVRRLDSILPYISNKEVHNLVIGGCDISSIESLSTLQSLEVLYLSGSYNLTSLEGIEKHIGLSDIEFLNCPNIADLTPLLQLPNLQRLTLSPDMEAAAQAQLNGASFEIRYKEEGI